MSEHPIIRIKTKAGRYVEYPLNKDEITVGRSVKADIMIDDSSVSRIHFKLVRQDTDYLIVDNQSSNGTYLRKRKVRQEVLQDGDDIFAGRVHIYFSNKASAGQQVDQGLETVDLHVNNYGETAEFPAITEPAPPKNLEAPTPPDGMPLPPQPPGTFGTVQASAPEPPPMAAPPQPAPPQPAPPQPAPPVTPPPMAAPPQAVPPQPAPPIAPAIPSSAPPPIAPSASPDYSGVMEEDGFASPIHRLLAVLIDGFLGILLMGPITGLSIMGVLSPTIASILSLLIALVLLLHPILGWLMFGKTIGKHFLGLQIIMEDDPQRKGLAFKPFIMRVLGYFISGVLLYLPFITVITDSEGRGFHDKLAGTRVVKRGG